MIRSRRLPVFLLSALVLGTAQSASAQPSADRAVLAKAILVKHCQPCHGDKEPRNGLNLLDDAQLKKLIRGGADKSELIQLIKAGNMPPGRSARLSEAEVQTLRDWVNSPPPTFNDAYVL